MEQPWDVIVVGGGLAGAKAAEALRERDFDGKAVLLADEEYLPYERPPLSKEFLAGKKSLGDFTVHDSDWYRDNKIDLRFGTEALAIDPTAHTVMLSDARLPCHADGPGRRPRVELGGSRASYRRAMQKRPQILTR